MQGWCKNIVYDKTGSVEKGEYGENGNYDSQGINGEYEYHDSW